MPFFNRHDRPAEQAAAPAATSPTPATPVETTEKRGLFGHKKSVSRQSVDANGRKSMDSSAAHHETLHKPDPNARLNEVTSVLPAAREKLRLAEQAEVAAQEALQRARLAVEEARRHVLALEKEAKDQAKAAELAAKDARSKLAEATQMKSKTSKMGRI